MMKKIIYGLGIALLLGGCDDFLEEYSQSQTVAKEVTHFDEILDKSDTNLNVNMPESKDDVLYELYLLKEKLENIKL